MFEIFLTKHFGKEKHQLTASYGSNSLHFSKQGTLVVQIAIFTE